MALKNVVFFRHFSFKSSLILFLLLMEISFCRSLLFAHSGRTDSYGGHNDRKNGGYHYHNTPVQPVKYQFNTVDPIDSAVKG